MRHSRQEIIQRTIRDQAKELSAVVKARDLSEVANRQVWLKALRSERDTVLKSIKALEDQAAVSPAERKAPPPMLHTRQICCGRPSAANATKSMPFG